MNLKSVLAGLLTGLVFCSAGVTAKAASAYDMEISQNGIEFICELEGFSATCYWDYAQSSIGYGTKCTHSSVQPHQSGLHTITREQAMEDMHSEINKDYIIKVRNQTQGLDLTQNQFDALISLAYNCGGGRNRIYNSPLVKYLRGELTEAEARNQFGEYLVYAGGSYLKGLHNRRVKEANLFFTEDNIQKPQNVTLSVQNDRSVFDITEEVIFEFHADYAESYFLQIDYNGEHLRTQEFENNTPYSCNFDQTGHYTVTVSAYNTYGSATSQKVDFDIVKAGDCPRECILTTPENRTLFHTGEAIRFDMTAENADFFVFRIMKDTTLIGTSPVTRQDDSYSYENSFQTAGTYLVYAEAYHNNYSVQSRKIILTIIDSEFDGDINLDGAVNTEDLILLQNYLQKQSRFSKAQSEAADINHDGMCNIFDFIALKQKLLSAGN